MSKAFFLRWLKVAHKLALYISFNQVLVKALIKIQIRILLTPLQKFQSLSYKYCLTT